MVKTVAHEPTLARQVLSAVTGHLGQRLRVVRTSFRSRIWKPAIRRAGLPERLRFHDLRHSHAKWLVSDGVAPNIVQAAVVVTAVRTSGS
jgi:integrase